MAAIYAPEMTHDRIAGFGRAVIATAQQGDSLAREIIKTAGYDLGQMAASVIRRLGMQREPAVPSGPGRGADGERRAGTARPRRIKSHSAVLYAFFVVR